MMRLRNSIYILLVVALIAAPLAYLPQKVSAQAVYNCLPTCEEYDGRFLSIAGVGLSTVADQPIVMTFAAPADSTGLEIGIFDGETGGQWDSQVTDLNFTLYADPEQTGDTSVIVAQRLGSSMPDNDWATFNITNVPAAQSPSGNFFYRLVVGPVAQGTVYLSEFKVRTDVVVMLDAQPFSYIAPLLTQADQSIIYPNYPDLSQTTYDGSFNFHVYAPSSSAAFTVWDGDFDFGSHDLTANDTDDPNTPNDTLPTWADPATTSFEGVAVGLNGSTGAPPDDSASASARRSPNVIYEITLPDGTIYRNSNPSGNVEWEKFSLASDPVLSPDYLTAGELPAGLYHIHALGVDMNNLNAWKFPFQVVGVCPLDPPATEPYPCKPPVFPYKIGDTIFRDPNGNGIQDEGEDGIPGVVVYLLDANGQPVRDENGNPIFAVTDENGHYFFNVPAGTYSVRVGDENFAADGPLAGMSSTTGGELQTHTVVDNNVLIYDFGYRVKPPEACVFTPGYWKTHPQEWPVTSITIAGVTYTRDQAIRIMSRAPKYDMTYQLFTQLVAAKLNVLIGNESQCIDADIEAAETWLVEHPLGSGVTIGSPAWIEIMVTFKNLDSYNKGKLCAEPCKVVPVPPTPLPPKPPKFTR